MKKPYLYPIYFLPQLYASLKADENIKLKAASPGNLMNSKPFNPIWTGRFPNLR